MTSRVSKIGNYMLRRPNSTIEVVAPKEEEDKEEQEQEEQEQEGGAGENRIFSYI
jgi:hypothetical protein